MVREVIKETVTYSDYTSPKKLLWSVVIFFITLITLALFNIEYAEYFFVIILVLFFLIALGGMFLWACQFRPKGLLRQEQVVVSTESGIRIMFHEFEFRDLFWSETVCQVYDRVEKRFKSQKLILLYPGGYPKYGEFNLMADRVGFTKESYADWKELLERNNVSKCYRHELKRDCSNYLYFLSLFTLLAVLLFSLIDFLFPFHTLLTIRTCASFLILVAIFSDEEKHTLLLFKTRFVAMFNYYQRYAFACVPFLAMNSITFQVEEIDQTKAAFLSAFYFIILISTFIILLRIDRQRVAKMLERPVDSISEIRCDNHQ